MCCNVWSNLYGKLSLHNKFYFVNFLNLYFYTTNNHNQLVTFDVTYPFKSFLEKYDRVVWKISPHKFKVPYHVYVNDCHKLICDPSKETW